MKAMKSNESIVDKISLKNIYTTDVHVTGTNVTGTNVRCQEAKYGPSLQLIVLVV